MKPDEEQCDDVVGYLTAEDVFERIRAVFLGLFGPSESYKRQYERMLEMLDEPYDEEEDENET